MHLFLCRFDFHTPQGRGLLHDLCIDDAVVIFGSAVGSSGIRRRGSTGSLLLGLLNLLPIRSFDGGRMLSAAISAMLGEGAAEYVLRLTSFLFLFLLWAVSVFFLLRAGDGLSLFCFSMSLFSHFFALSDQV